jgi:glycosyltransferase involved in cell wall biosynthesis
MQTPHVQSILISIVICTHNRSADVVECLDALFSTTPSSNVEVVVVDSGSNEEHSRRVERYLHSKPSVRYARLDVAGTSLARNAGLRLARGEWVWWLDDDAIPTADWPEKLTEVISQADAKTAIIGGRVVPKFEPGADVARLTERWRLLLSCIEHNEPGYVSDGRNIACANMLMKKDVALQLGGFSERLGRSPAQMVTGEESLLIEVMQEHGFKCAYAPTLSVLHKVSSQRLTLDWVRERAYWEGHVRFRIHNLLNRKISWSLNPLKLRFSIYVFQLLSAVKPQDADLTIRMNLARGTLDAIGNSRASRQMP